MLMVCRTNSDNIEWCKGIKMYVLYENVLPKIEYWLLAELSESEKEEFPKGFPVSEKSFFKKEDVIVIADRIAKILELVNKEKIDRTYPFYPKKNEFIFIKRVVVRAAQRMGIEDAEKMSDVQLTKTVLLKLKKENSSDSFPKRFHGTYVPNRFRSSMTPYFFAKTQSVFPILFPLILLRIQQHEAC